MERLPQKLGIKKRHQLLNLGLQKVKKKQPKCIVIEITNFYFILYFLDINELNLPKTCTTEFPDPDDLLSFKLIICPDEVFIKTI